MAVNVVIPGPPSSNLIELEQVKVRLGITGDAQDDLLVWLIEEAVDIVEQELDRPLARQRYIETFGSFGELLIPLSRRPVESTDLELRKGGVLVPGVLHDGKEGLIRIDNTAFDSTVRCHGRFNSYDVGETAEDYEASYWAGYTELPISHRRAANGVVGWLLGRMSPHADWSSVRADGVEVRLRDRSEMPPDLIAALEGL